jgi:formylglycine-generating enzyme required for sulfatase activity
VADNKQQKPQPQAVQKQQAAQQAAAQQQAQERTVRLVSIVAIDVVGFSTMSERDHRRAASMVESLRARIEKVAHAHSGRLFNTAGDGFMLEFASAGSALGAIQDLLDKRAKGEPPIRVGAHVGDVVVTATNDLLGHGVNVAARLQQLAGPGSALVSSEFRSMAHSSPTAAFQSRGRQPLDNIEQKVQTFEILSRRQRFARMSKRVMSIGSVVAVIAALAYFSPMLFQLAKPYIPALQTQTTPAASAATNTVSHVATPATPTPAPLPAAAPTPPPAPGSDFADCSSCPQMTVLAGGLFKMGSPAAERGRNANEGPQREVSIAPFAVSTHEITFAQWDACVAGGGCGNFRPPDRGWGRTDHPVINVSWDDAKAYVDWLNQQPGAGHYRLLSEAEWEYAARAGGELAYGSAAILQPAAATFHARRTSAVGAHPANAFGLFDMVGNAGEWVEDCYAPNYNLAPVTGAAVEADECSRRVYRGGGFADLAPALRVAARKSGAPNDRTLTLGFRIAKTIG